MIRKALTTFFALSIASVVGILFCNTTSQFLLYLFTWFVPIWILAGILVGTYQFIFVLRNQELPKYMLSLSKDEQNDDIAELIFHLSWQPRQHILITSVIGGILIFLVAFTRRTFPDIPTYWLAGFFVGILAGACQGYLDLLFPLIAYRYFCKKG